jgi:hypothetical protein
MAGLRRYELGMLRHRLPMHVRVMVDGAHASELMPEGAGVVVLQRTPSGGYVLITAAGHRPPFAGTFEPEG